MPQHTRPLFVPPSSGQEANYRPALGLDLAAFLRHSLFYSLSLSLLYFELLLDSKVAPHIRSSLQP